VSPRRPLPRKPALTLEGLGVDPAAARMLAALVDVIEALRPLDAEARRRVLTYVADRFAKEGR